MAIEIRATPDTQIKGFQYEKGVKSATIFCYFVKGFLVSYNYVITEQTTT